MYVNRAQKIFTYAGYYANFFARESARCIEKLTRPKKGTGEKIEWILKAFVSVPAAIVFVIPALAFYGMAACSGSGRFELIQSNASGSSETFWAERSIKVLSQNACFQDPWSPLTGGVATPFEPIEGAPTRIAAYVDAIVKEEPTVYLGQEFENLGAQDECIRLMQKKGFRYFVRDLGSNDPIRNNSGLFVASKTPLQNLQFVPYPLADRNGLAKGSSQGALTFTIPVLGKDLRLINVHLNYGEGKENQEARNRQLKNHVVPLLNKGPAVLFGDLNFDTSKVDRAVSGLLGFTNALEGKTTCTDEGKHRLREKPTANCSECEERLDGAITDPNQVRLAGVEIKPMRLKGGLLSDHFAAIAKIEIIS